MDYSEHSQQEGRREPALSPVKRNVIRLEKKESASIARIKTRPLWLSEGIMGLP